MKSICKHCQNLRSRGPRGLCWGCYRNPLLRARYGIGSYSAPVPAEELNETLADLEALVESQRPTMPGVSKYDSHPEEIEETVPVVVLRGLMHRRGTRIYRELA